jgi:diguanylate cyclase (GGDEF)-like protein/PAS domain S-box-containing protein
MIKVAIVGGGETGSALLDMFHCNGEVKTVGISEKNADAGTLAIARERNIFVAKDLDEIYTLGPEIIINVTGDPETAGALRATIPAGTEVIEGTGARFLWEMLQRQSTAKKEMETLYHNGLALTSAKTLKDVLTATLEKAMALTEMPAGSIALRRKDEMEMAAHRGLSSPILNVPRWKPKPSGLTSYILKHKELVEIGDIRKYPFIDRYALKEDGVKAILAAPLAINGDIVGILYLDDFTPREFSERQRNLIRLFGTQAAQAIDKFRILDELYRVIGELDEATAYLRNVLDDTQDMIATTDNEGRIVEFSKGGERILGYSRDEVIGMDASQFYVDPEERATVLDTLRRKGAIYNYETRLRRKDLSVVDISLTISQLRNKMGNIIGTVGISKDITEEKSLRNELRLKNEELGELNLRLEDKVLERTRELEKINRELKRANEIKARFISNMSHELRTPLNSILGFSEILLEHTFGPLNEKQQRHVSNISASGKHLLQLVTNILDLAKIEAGKVDVFYEDFPVADAVDEVVMIMNSLASKKSIHIAVEAPRDHVFSTDKVKFKQILYNLLSNAIKFSPEGGDVGIKVEFPKNKVQELPWAVEGQTLLKVSVRDKGTGIKPRDMERIFDEFEQADSSLSRDYGGTGLGLSLTKKLIDLQGGQIHVESVYGEGSEFTFSLPSGTREKRKEPAAELKSGPLTFPWLKEEAPLVLVVEDDLPTSEILTIHLTRGGYRVAHAYDGIEAISKAKEMRPFVIALDVMLPKKDGWEVLQSLKADPDTSDIPVIIHSITDNKDLAYALGASDYLLKPIDKGVLLGKLSELSLFSGKNSLPLSLLLLSDDPSTQDHVCSICSNNGYLFHSTATEEEGLALALATRPGIIMIDLSMCGFDFITQLKGNPLTSGIPIFALTGKDLPLEDRMNMTGQIERIFKKDALIAHDLVMHLKDLEILHPRRAGLIDEITGLFNHRYFQLRLAQEVSRAVRYKMPLTLALLDIDNFSHYVKSEGADHGNLVLKKISDLLKRNTRGSDVIVRYGGDSFSTILPNTILAPAVKLSRRFGAIIRDYPFLREEIQPKGRITVSIGVAPFEDHSPEEFIKCAEIALSTAMRKGGDTVEVFGNIG